ncbi:MAG: matrixin family metalloprotease [Solirubrobacteraceae bacterium]
MTVRRIIFAVWLALVLAAPATAGAAGRPQSAGALVRAATAAGERYWGAVPCTGGVAVIARQPLAAGVDRFTDAWVTFETPLGANDLSAPAADYTRCTIALARWRWPTASSMAQDWDLLCTTITHELGHLLGHPHDATPGSVMAPVFTDRSTEPAVCRSARPHR